MTPDLADNDYSQELAVRLISSENDGNLREILTNSRVILISCPAYRSMCDALYEQFRSGSGVILLRMGQGYARKLTEGISKLNLTTEEAIRVYQKLSYLAGWGSVRIMIEDEKRAMCTVRKSPFVLRRNDVGSTSCFFSPVHCPRLRAQLSGKSLLQGKSSA